MGKKPQQKGFSDTIPALGLRRVNAAPALVWQIIRTKSSFLLNRNKFTKEPNNLRGLNNFRYNGLVHDKTVGVEPAADGKGVVLSIKKSKGKYHPKNSQQKMELKKDGRHTMNSIITVMKKQKYRNDLKGAALRRASTIRRNQKAASTKQ